MHFEEFMACVPYRYAEAERNGHSPEHSQVKSTRIGSEPLLKTFRKRVVNRIASRHIAGPELSDALTVCKWAELQKMGTNLSRWAYPDDSTETMFRHYAAILKSIHDNDLDSFLGVKIGGIGDDFGRFSELVGIARENHVRLHVDSFGPESAPVNFSFLEKAAGVYDNLGCTLPSRWRRSLDDVDRVIELGLKVRVVKGQWPDSDNAKLDCRQNYLAIIGKLAGRARQVGVATHDKRLAKESLQYLSTSGTEFEMQQYFSLPLNGRSLSRTFGCPYRISLAYGYAYLPYNVRFILSRPGMISWIVSDYAFKPARPWLQRD